jgi:hypothetical protein
VVYGLGVLRTAAVLWLDRIGLAHSPLFADSGADLLPEEIPYGHAVPVA